MVDIEEIVIPAIVFATIFGVIYTFLSTRNRERMALIQNNQTDFKYPARRRWTTRAVGMAAVGFGVGILLGYFLEVYTGLDEPGYFAMIGICMGIALILHHNIQRKEDKEDGKL